MGSKKKIAVIAYAMSPTRGSEYAQGWNYVCELSKYYDVFAYVGSSDGHIGGLSEIRKCSDLLDAKIHYVELKKSRLFINNLFVYLKFPWIFVLMLRSWNREAVRLIKSHHEVEQFSQIHHLGPIGYKTPSDLTGLDIPSYWGPIGGFQFVNLRLAWVSSKKYFCSATLRNILTWLIAKGPTLKKATSNFNKFSFATLQNAFNFQKNYSITGPIISDQAASESNFIFLDQKTLDDVLEVIWCGSVDGRKNPKLFIDIATEAHSRKLPIKFTLIGSGPLLKSMINISKKRNLTNIIFTGRLERKEVEAYMSKSDALVFTSLSEANTSTFFEGIEKLLIPICMDLDGFTSNINPMIGFKIDVNQTYSNIILNYLDALVIILNSDERVEYMRNISVARLNMTWSCLVRKHITQFVDDNENSIDFL